MTTRQRDFYAILGVERTATDADIKRAFRKLAQQWHPDVSPDPDADARFKEINEAYQVLSDPERRRTYDTFGEAGLGGAGAGAAGSAGGFPGFGDFGDLFDAFFGGQSGAGVRRGRPAVGSDLRYDLRITFAEAMKGTEKDIEFPVLDRCETCGGAGAKAGSAPVTCPGCNGRGEVRTVRDTMLGQMINVAPCPRCRGEGRIVDDPCEACRGEGRTERTKRLRVTVPPGIDDGHQIRLSGEGEVGRRGGPAGSLYVAVNVTPHASLKREGTELYYELDLSIAQATLGTRVSVPAVDGDEEVDVKPGTQPGAEIRLRGKGAPHLRRPGARGDLHVLVDVRVPTKLSARQRELLEEFAAESGEHVGRGGAKGGGIVDRLKDALG
jgi:molecular chaperone DnaJ